MWGECSIYDTYIMHINKKKREKGGKKIIINQSNCMHKTNKKHIFFKQINNSSKQRLIYLGIHTINFLSFSSPLFSKQIKTIWITIYE